LKQLARAAAMKGRGRADPSGGRDGRGEIGGKRLENWLSESATRVDFEGFGGPAAGRGYREWCAARLNWRAIWSRGRPQNEAQSPHSRTRMCTSRNLSKRRGNIEFQILADNHGHVEVLGERGVFHSAAASEAAGRGAVAGPVSSKVRGRRCERRFGTRLKAVGYNERGPRLSF